MRNLSNLPILDKVIKIEDEDYFNSNKSFMSIVSSKGLFSFNGIFNTKFNDYELESNELYNAKYYIAKSKNNFGWVKKDLIKKNAEYVEAHKIIIPFSYGDPKRFDTVLGKPKYSEPYSIASESYLFIGIPSKLTKEECLNVMSYITTKFFRFLVRVKKFTQDAPKGVYQFVPMQDFNKSWTDEELYEKYKLTNDEILLIEKNCKANDNLKGGDSMSNNYKNYNPDILETIANLSNDEVFTPPKLANEILDLLPEEIWSDSTITFLDPAVKTGIFLREIASRLIDGLAEEIPDLQERVNHILTKQVFGIGITELTTLMARRTVYCSMTANGEFSICTEFDNEKGNIILPDTEHTWDKNGRCEYCGANKDNYSGGDNRENYAYPFIHDNFEKEFGNMKFDVIIGNPPYQLSDGGAKASAMPLYHKFVEKAINLNPNYITMITPSRWFTGGRGLDSFRKSMMRDKRMKKIVDYNLSTELFPTVGITGGVNYFLWSKSHNGKCEVVNVIKGESNKSNRFLQHEDLDIFINDNVLFNIVSKVSKNKTDKFSKLVSPRDPYENHPLGKLSINPKKGSVPIYDFTGKGYVNPSEVVNRWEYHYTHKIFISYAYIIGGTPVQVLNKPFVPEEDAICSGTYLTIGPFKDKNEADNAVTYMQTKFFRALVYSLKRTQHGTRKVYQLVPIQDFSKPWTDDELYRKYKLTQQEIDYIEENIRPMNDKTSEELDITVED